MIWTRAEVGGVSEPSPAQLALRVGRAGARARASWVGMMEELPRRTQRKAV